MGHLLDQKTLEASQAKREVKRYKEFKDQLQNQVAKMKLEKEKGRKKIEALREKNKSQENVIVNFKAIQELLVEKAQQNQKDKIVVSDALLNEILQEMK